jgi:hypothetical protein
MRLFSRILVIGLIAVFTVAAKADTFNFSLLGPTDFGTGIITATQTTPGEYLINGITGSMDGFAITSLLPVGTYRLLSCPRMTTYSSIRPPKVSLTWLACRFNLQMGLT